MLLSMEDMLKVIICQLFRRIIFLISYLCVLFLVLSKRRRIYVSINILHCHIHGSKYTYSFSRTMHTDLKECSRIDVGYGICRLKQNPRSRNLFFLNKFYENLSFEFSIFKKMCRLNMKMIMMVYFNVHFLFNIIAKK